MTYRNKESGQVALTAALLITTFLFLLKFVIDTGTLVAAKINLQNAADMAAYSGAATQARQMTDIAYLNYEMRRQYRKFLFRYYLIGNMSSNGFAAAVGSAASGPSQIDFPFGPDHARLPPVVFNTPSMCIAFDARDNLCVMSTMPDVNASLPAPNGNPILQSTFDVGQVINSIIKNKCERSGRQNQTALYLWLYGADPQGKLMEDRANSILASQGITDPKQCDNLSAGAAKNACFSAVGWSRMKDYARGLGLYPRELILKSRIETLASVVNEPAKKGVTRTSIQAFKSGLEPLAFERTTLAFESAYNTLSDTLFPETEDPESQITLDELMPTTGKLLDLAALPPVSFSTFYTYFNTASGGGASCTQQLDRMKVKNLPVGFYKKPESLVYYAVRLSAQVRLAFSPFGPVTLTAYAAAQPFGSRIGPPNPTWTKTSPANTVCPTGQIARQGGPLDCANLESELRALPNQVTTAEPSSGFFDRFVLFSYYAPMMAQANARPDRAFINKDLDYGERLAMAPTPSEAGLYAIPNDVDWADERDKLHVASGDYFEQVFHKEGEEWVRHIWAPIERQDSPVRGRVSDRFKDQLNALNGQIDSSLLDLSKEGIEKYLNALGTGQDTEYGETFANAVIIDTTHHQSYPPPGKREPLVAPGKAFLTESQMLRSAWAPKMLDKEAYARGRVGYSVKMVSFSQLRTPGLATTDGKKPWRNAPDLSTADDDTLNDRIRH